MSAEAKLLTHLRSYQRLIEAEAARLQRIGGLSTDERREQLRRHLRAMRLATRDLQASLKAPDATRPVRPAPPAPAASATAR